MSYDHAIDLSVTWLGQTMPGCLYNASGVWCREEDELEALLASDAAAVISKSATLAPRDGNPEPRYCRTAMGSINSMGLPNRGFDYYLDYARRYRYGSGKPLFLSLSGLSLDDNCAMLRRLAEEGLPAVPEVNLSCPNVPGKPQLGYDFAATAEALGAFDAAYSGLYGVKLPPYFDPAHFAAMAEILNRHPRLAFVTCINSIGNGLVVDIDSEAVVIKPKDGLGGLGGDYVLPTALANVREFYRLLPGKDVVGCGGVKSGREAFMHILAGARAVQVGTCLYHEGPGAFARIAGELAALMRVKGYRRLDDFRGRLRTL
ncbi:dihydroorotate oxidase [Chromobacterium violaceum]|uniref:dihydroorotate oxidase n=1 Tax=Chromobacterium violaceum TaxID=536 RepID=UPI000C128E07|nr:dihydroorotate oxidase [Chromobacterium violaceum]ATP29834.1 dihydroorotate oxidase [Chromobacterium violaceum]ATP33740.1 dihydroorotate oxidase [Chromobacterium violaceum]